MRNISICLYTANKLVIECIGWLRRTMASEQFYYMQTKCPPSKTIHLDQNKPQNTVNVNFLIAT